MTDTPSASSLGSPPRYWDTADVMRELRVSRPTAYRLMRESGALIAHSRHLKIRVEDFLAYLSKKEP